MCLSISTPKPLIFHLCQKVFKLFFKLVFSIDFSAFASVCNFFSTELLLIAWN